MIFLSCDVFIIFYIFFFFFSSRRRHTRLVSDWSSDVCSSDLSELLPYFQKVVDKVTFVRSMTTDRIDHSTAQFTFVTGRGFTGFPAIGSWVSYALGTEHQNLPAHIARGQGPTIGDRARHSAWLPRLD